MFFTLLPYANCKKKKEENNLSSSESCAENNLIKKSFGLLFTFNSSYQTIATGGLLATIVTVLLKETLDYSVPSLMQLAITMAAGLVSLACSTLEGSVTKAKENSLPENYEENNIELNMI